MAKDIYVRISGGSNNNNGLTSASPVQTREHAQNLAVPGDRILTYAGDNFSGQFNQTKSGIRWDTYGGSNKSIFSGFVTLSGWVSQGNGIWSSTNASLGSTVKKITLDAEAQRVGRLVKFNETDHGYLTVSNATSNSISNSAISNAPNLVGGQITLKSSLYTVDILNITGQSGSTLTFSGSLTYGNPKNGYGFIVSHHINTLTEFGEWSYNAGTKTVSMYFGTENPNFYTVKASASNYCIYAGGGINNVEYNNIIVEGSNLDGAGIASANTFTFNEMEFRQIGRNGIHAPGHPNLTVYKSNLKAINNNAVWTSVGSSYATVDFNTVEDVARDLALTNGGLGAGAGGGGYGLHVPWGGSVITRNVVKYVAGIGIRFEKAYSKCNYNHVHNVLNRFADLGGIYNWNGSTNLDKQPGMECRFNHVHDIEICNFGTTYSNSLPLSHGIYMDDHSAGDPNSLLQIWDNRVWNIQGNGFNFRNVESLDVRRNLAFNCDQALRIVGDQSDEMIEDLTMKGNVFVARDAGKDVLGLYNNHGNMVNWVAVIPNAPNPSRWDENVLARPIAPTGTIVKRQNLGNTVNLSFDAWQSDLGWDTNSTGSPVTITDVDQFRLETNYSATPKTVDLSDGTYVDMRNVQQPTSLEIEPYGGVLLIKTSSTTPVDPDPDPEPETAPSVVLSSPSGQKMIIRPTNLVLVADVTLGTNAIQKVDFFNGQTLIGTSTAAPYVHTWANPTEGVKNIHAVVTDVDGLTDISESVAVIVYDFIGNDGHFRLHMNEGSAATVTHDGNTFVGGLYFYEGQSLVDNVSPPTSDAIFQTGRAYYDLNYVIPVPNGIYTVRTYHNEPWHGVNDGQTPVAGKRVFDIRLQNNLVYDNFDIFVVNNNQNTTLVFEDIEVTDGFLRLDLSASVDMANLSALSITPKFLAMTILTDGDGTAFDNSGDDPDARVPGTWVALVASPNEGSVFVNWTVDGNVVSTNPNFGYQLFEDTTITAHFELAAVLHSLTVEVNPTDGGTTNITSGEYEAGTVVSLVATPEANHSFVNWTRNGSVLSTNPSYNYVVPNSASTVVANFAAEQYTVQVTAGTGGSVTGGGTYNTGATATLTATPDPGYGFTSWSDGSTANPYQLTVTEDVTLSATFSQGTYVLTVSASPVDGGNASGGGTYSPGTSVNLSSEPNVGFRFINWVKNGIELSNQPFFSYETGTTPETIVAVFEEVVFTVSVSESTGGSATGGGEYQEGDSATLSATAEDGFDFLGWYDKGVKVTEENPYTFPVFADRSLSAMFATLHTLAVGAAAHGTATGGGTFETYTSVTVNATPDMGYRFVGWFENGANVSTDARYTFLLTYDRSLQARFVAMYGNDPGGSLEPVNAYTVHPTAGKGGIVSGGGTYFAGETAVVTATPNGNNSFIRWEKDGVAVSGEEKYSFTVDGDAFLTAIFGPKVKYRCNYRNHFNDLCRVDISFKGYEGDTINLRSAEDNGCIIERECSEDPYDPIVVTKARSTFIQEEHNPINIQELQEAEDRHFVLSFYVEGVLHFQGFVVPDGIQQIFQSAPYDVVINATDGLKLLSGIPYVHNNLPGGRNPMNYFRQILFHNLGLTLPIKWVNTLTNDAWPEEDVFTGSLRWSARGEGFSDYAGTVKDGLFILENMLKSMQCRIFQDGGYWVIWRINDVVSGQFTYKSISGDLDAMNVVDSSVDINRTVGGVRDGFDYSFIEEDAYVTSKKALRTVKVVYEHEQRENILPNGSMDIVNSLFNAPLYWGITSLSGNKALVQSVPSLSADRGHAVQVDNSWPGSSINLFGMIPNQLPIDSDILYRSFNFSFTFSLESGVFVDPDGFIVWESTHIPLLIAIDTGEKTYYLNKFGFWTEQYYTLNIEVEGLKVGDVANVDFRAKQPNIILPLPSTTPIGSGNEPFLVVSFGIPEGRKIIFDDIKMTVDPNTDIYEATSSVQNNTASEDYALKISTSHNGFHISNFMSNFDQAGAEKFFSDGKLTQATLTEMTAHAILRNRYKPSILFEGSLYARKYSYGEIYNVMLLDGKKLLPLKSSWNTETNTIKLTATEVRDDGTGIYIRHYSSNDNEKQMYG